MESADFYITRDEEASPPVDQNPNPYFFYVFSQKYMTTIRLIKWLRFGEGERDGDNFEGEDPLL